MKCLTPCERQKDKLFQHIVRNIQFQAIYNIDRYRISIILVQKQFSNMANIINMSGTLLPTFFIKIFVRDPFKYVFVLTTYDVAIKTRKKQIKLEP